MDIVMPKEEKVIYDGKLYNSEALRSTVETLPL